MHYFSVMERMVRFICLVLLVLPVGLKAAQTDGRLIILRDQNSIELYLSLPGAAMEPALDYDASDLLRTDGSVDFKHFEDDTAPIVDQILTKTTLTADGAPADVEGLSFMLHPVENEVNFDTPWDALLTVTGCSATDTALSFALADTNAYLGAILYPVDATATLDWTLPQTGRGALQLEVLEFTRDHAFAPRFITIADGGTIRLEASTTPILSISAISLFVGAFAALIFAVLGFFAKQRRVKYARSNKTTHLPPAAKTG